MNTSDLDITDFEIGAVLDNGAYGTVSAPIINFISLDKRTRLFQLWILLQEQKLP